VTVQTNQSAERQLVRHSLGDVGAPITVGVADVATGTKAHSSRPDSSCRVILTVWTCFSALVTLAQVGPAYDGFGFTDDGEHEQSIGRRIAAYRRSLSVQPSEICLSWLIADLQSDFWRRNGDTAPEAHLGWE